MSRRHQILFALAAAAMIALAIASPASASLPEPDPCGDVNSGASAHLIDPDIGDGTPGKKFVCGDPITDLPGGAEVLPEQGAPDPIDPSGSFDTNYAYIIGPNGAAANWTGISGNQVLVAALEGVGEGIAVSVFVAYAFPPLNLAATLTSVVAGAVANTLVNVGTQIYDEYSDMAGSDWGYYVPQNSGSGDWNGWIYWDGLGDVKTVSVDPHLFNDWPWNLSDYEDKQPTAYVRMYAGVSLRPVQQGDGIVGTVWSDFSGGGHPFTSALRRRAPRQAGRAGIARVKLSGNRETLRGSSRNDELSIRVGNHALVGGDGHDQLGGGPGADVLLGGAGGDELRAFEGNDQLQGGAGTDLLLGHNGDDALVGGPGDDVLSDGSGPHSGGRTLLDGGPGRDFLVARDRRGDDELRCGPGRDVALADRSDTISKDCERVIIRRPPRGTKPPAMGHTVGRPAGVAEPEWSFDTMMEAQGVRARAGRGNPPRHSARLRARLNRVG